ncbi:hypothetical protein [Helicobacter cinaedi]|uniref:hypothetical protein n=7 Tax=Helicobacter cinaedi TaxID=213 RepID=UPI000DC6DE05|nr:hypothetical protein [Helicobacter cinaedi]BBB20428.1 hypothetical protein HC081234_16050 [Helicobacter cinaedi]
MTPKDFIEQAKDYADVADASYAMLHYIDNNEEIDTFLDTMKANNPNPKVRPPARWIYADNIKLGYKKDNGQPTAYALAIEARFSQNIEIKTPKYNNPSKLELKLINNTIQNLIYRNKKDSKTKRITL